MAANNQYSNLTDDFYHLNLGGSPVPQGQVQPQASQSPGMGKKVAPLVPPKPKKASPVPGYLPPPPPAGVEEYEAQAMYSNLPAGAQVCASPVGVVASVPGAATTRPGVQGYYAVNAPAPGTVGVASARLNKAYTGGKDNQPPSHTASSTPTNLQHTMYNSPTPLSYSTHTRTTPNYTPPPPQPSYSYTPTSRVSPQYNSQPLYSNTASQPIYNNSTCPQQASLSMAPTPVPAPAPTPPAASPAYANVATNGAGDGYGSRALYANLDNGHGTGTTSYATYGSDEEFPPPPPPDEAGAPPPPSPPSPVSSSYSELRRATHHTPAAHPVSSSAAAAVPVTQTLSQGMPPAHNTYGTYAPSSQTSSTYESIYEPITPRPSSQMSNKSGGYSVYGPYTSPHARGLAPAPSNQPIANPDKVGKEAEVDALTNLLVQSMDSSNDPDFFGICTRCGEKVVGEGSGCTAMEQVYHIKCFVCVICHLQLQGKPFYALESKPYCEVCYLNTLEKCCVCAQPILDRILRATGKPYHPQCFKCVICNKSLDGIPFTVDASNQIHCIEDFHKKFAPRCSVCAEPIMPEPGQDETVRVVALDRSFHVNCYRCEDCGMVLSSEAEGRGCYPLDGHVLCKSCNAKRVQALTSKVATQL
ncbi:uncharacterized protein LOC143020948 [Oratosquilla oratoria]|uniref:uncharacterized protein LOC143020948 n=1 Tax=Oratosquilla oratoria TaxID=337810 RepID=UPI003F75B752